MLRSLLDRLSRALPSQCAVCGAWPAEPLCADCMARFAAPMTRCITCALPLPEGAPAQCGACLREPPPLQQCIAAVPYDYPWSNLIARFKFDAEPGWGRTLASLMRRAPTAADALQRADVVVAVALTRARLRQRGFNQALELARQLAPHKTRADLLLRIRETDAQSTLPRQQRLRNLRDAFAVADGSCAAVRGKTILLIDDVMTTGATLHAAARTLRAAGATRVDALVLARTAAD